MKKHNAGSYRGSYRLKGNVGHTIVMEAQRTLMGMERILYMIGCLGLILWVNQVGAPYAPSEYSDSVDKKEYYSSLRRVIENLPWNNLLVILSDLLHVFVLMTMTISSLVVGLAGESLVCEPGLCSGVD